MAGGSLEGFVTVLVDGDPMEIKDGGVIHRHLIEAGLIKDPGCEPESRCNRDGCEGTMEDVRHGGCSCHMGYPPCGHCVTTHISCDTCGEDFYLTC